MISACMNGAFLRYLNDPLIQKETKYMAKQKSAFPPMSREEMRARNIEQLDFIFVSGDAYIDHPSFGAAIITRLLESRGYSVGIIAQPDWQGVEAFRVLGKPRLAFLVSSGNIDSMVNH